MKLSCKRTRRQANTAENVKATPKLISGPSRPATRSSNSTTSSLRLSNLSSQKSQKFNTRTSSAFGLGNFVPTSCIYPRVGDIIEFDRKLYSHWALHVGENQVIHVSGESSDIATEDVFVRQCSLQDVAAGSLVRINNRCVPAKERNLKALETSRIVANARKNLGKKVTYNMLSNTAEHYVTLWRYGEAWSDQADMLMTVMNRRSSLSPPSPEGVGFKQPTFNSTGVSSSEDSSSCDSMKMTDDGNQVKKAGGTFTDHSFQMSLLAGLTAIFQTDLHTTAPTSIKSSKNYTK